MGIDRSLDEEGVPDLEGHRRDVGLPDEEKDLVAGNYA
jgi:hypothetical protein